MLTAEEFDVINLKVASILLTAIVSQVRSQHYQSDVEEKGNNHKLTKRTE